MDDSKTGEVPVDPGFDVLFAAIDAYLYVADKDGELWASDSHWAMKIAGTVIERWFVESGVPLSPGKYAMSGPPLPGTIPVLVDPEWPQSVLIEHLKLPRRTVPVHFVREDGGCINAWHNPLTRDQLVTVSYGDALNSRYLDLIAPGWEIRDPNMRRFVGANTPIWFSDNAIVQVRTIRTVEL